MAFPEGHKPALVFYRSADTPVHQGLPHGLDIFTRSAFYAVFSFKMNNPCALLGLLCSMVTHFNEGFDDPFKGVYLIIPYNQVYRLVLINIGFYIFPFFNEYLIGYREEIWGEQLVHRM